MNLLRSGHVLSFPGCFLTVIQQLSPVSTVCCCPSLLTVLEEGQSLLTVLYLLPALPAPYWSSTSISSCSSVLAMPAGAFPGQGFPAWLAVSAPPSPLQTPVICTEAAWPPPCLQPNPGAPWNPGFFAICNCKRTEMKQRTSVYSENLLCLLF